MTLLLALALAAAPTARPMLWAAQGWSVVLPNPRGASGHGMAWQDRVRADWGGRPYEDVLAFTDGAVASRDAVRRGCARRARATAVTW